MSAESQLHERLLAPHTARLVDLAQCQVHKGVAVLQMPIERLSILEFDEDGLALCCIEQGKGQLWKSLSSIDTTACYSAPTMLVFLSPSLFFATLVACPA